MGALGPCIRICEQDILAERWSQLKLHGDQRHLPDGTNHQSDRWLATYYHGTQAAAEAAHTATWRDTLLDEVFATFAESERVPLRAALVRAATTAIAWVEALDNRSGDRSPLPPDQTELTDGAVLALVAA